MKFYRVRADSEGFGNIAAFIANKKEHGYLQFTFGKIKLFRNGFSQKFLIRGAKTYIDRR